MVYCQPHSIQNWQLQLAWLTFCDTSKIWSTTVLTEFFEIQLKFKMVTREIYHAPWYCCATEISLVSILQLLQSQNVPGCNQKLSEILFLNQHRLDQAVRWVVNTILTSTVWLMGRKKAQSRCVNSAPVMNKIVIESARLGVMTPGTAAALPSNTSGSRPWSQQCSRWRFIRRWNPLKSSLVKYARLSLTNQRVVSCRWLCTRNAAKGNTSLAATKSPVNRLTRWMKMSLSRGGNAGNGTSASWDSPEDFYFIYVLGHDRHVEGVDQYGRCGGYGVACQDCPCCTNSREVNAWAALSRALIISVGIWLRIMTTKRWILHPVLWLPGFMGSACACYTCYQVLAYLQLPVKKRTG